MNDPRCPRSRALALPHISLTRLPPSVPDGEILDIPLEEWCAGVEQLLQDLAQKESEDA